MNLGDWSPEPLNFCTVRPNILGVMAALFAFVYNNAYQFTCTEQNTAGNCPVLTVAPKLLLIGMGLAVCHPSGANDL